MYPRKSSFRGVVDGKPDRNSPEAERKEEHAVIKSVLMLKEM